MIRLTSAQDGTTVYIAPENITFITKTRMLFGEVETTITASDGMLYVTESPEEVVRKVLEWKLEMERYKAAAIVALTHRANENNPYMPPLDAQRELEILAGLEEN